jgi:hypothetical protein
MAWQNPKLDWVTNPKNPVAEDFNRIEGNVEFLKCDIETKKGAIVDALNEVGLETELTDTHAQIATKITAANQGTKIYTPTTANMTIPKGFHSGQGYVKGDVDLKAENIRKDVSVFGIVGNKLKYGLGDIITSDKFEVPGESRPLLLYADTVYKYANYLLPNSMDDYIWVTNTSPSSNMAGRHNAKTGVLTTFKPALSGAYCDIYGYAIGENYIYAKIYKDGYRFAKIDKSLLEVVTSVSHGLETNVRSALVCCGDKVLARLYTTSGTPNQKLVYYNSSLEPIWEIFIETDTTYDLMANYNRFNNHFYVYHSNDQLLYKIRESDGAIIATSTHPIESPVIDASGNMYGINKTTFSFDRINPNTLESIWAITYPNVVSSGTGIRALRDGIVVYYREYHMGPYCLQRHDNLGNQIYKRGVQTTGLGVNEKHNTFIRRGYVSSGDYYPYDLNIDELKIIS